ncbi:hypothetical protein BDV95DRAFT_384655 [Massariosphaeria phaeospora]|uniref:Uncharacterized protein n=1 Tax=Massariosphaeria phaeospora TaxID=100035 RepID=A0A7C8MLZ2_9PLEO|nr:hypothetical protein BDV95DRAFT_384655 [Massariosphaeria phaeospora]
MRLMNVPLLHMFDCRHDDPRDAYSTTPSALTNMTLVRLCSNRMTRFGAPTARYECHSYLLHVRTAFTFPISLS